MFGKKKWTFILKVHFFIRILPWRRLSSPQKPKRLPPRGKLSAELTDEGDIRPLPFKAPYTVGRGLAAAEKA